MTFDMRHIARGDATRHDDATQRAFAGGKVFRWHVSRGRSRWLCEGIVVGEEKDPGRAMTNDKPVKDRVESRLDDER